MTELGVVKLNLGAGRSSIPGFVNVDISERAELTLDLGRDRLPFADGSVDLVFSYHTLEHVDNYLFALSEIHRVLKHGGRFLVGLPYVTLTEYHLVNPFHQHNFNEHSFDFFEAGKLQGSAAEESTIQFKLVFHRLHYMGMFHVIPPPLRGWCRRHLFNVVRKIDYGLICIKGSSEPPVITRELKRDLAREFRRCLQSRVPHDPPSRSEHVAARGVRRLRGWWRGQDS